eukprot:scaffold2062_cov15-Tisochrysis_lutea.AAC.1
MQTGSKQCRPGELAIPPAFSGAQVRWSSFEYALVARIDPSESKRAAVKATADCLLEVLQVLSQSRATFHDQDLLLPDPCMKNAHIIPAFLLFVRGSSAKVKKEEVNAFGTRMKKHFDHTIATNAVPHYTCRTGLACGGAFAQHNGGHFLTGAGLIQEMVT